MGIKLLCARRNAYIQAEKAYLVDGTIIQPERYPLAHGSRVEDGYAIYQPDECVVWMGKTAFRRAYKRSLLFKHLYRERRKLP